MKKEITLYTHAIKWFYDPQVRIETTTYKRESTEHYMCALISEQVIEIEEPELSREQALEIVNNEAKAKVEAIRKKLEAEANNVIEVMVA